MEQEKEKKEKKKKSIDWFASLFPKDDKKLESHQMWWGLSTVSALVGIENFREIVGAAVAHTAAWYAEGQGPSVVYNFLTGVRLNRKQYAYTYIPLGTDVYDLTEMPSDSNLAHALALAAGYIASQQKWV